MNPKFSADNLQRISRQICTLLEANGIRPRFYLGLFDQLSSGQVQNGVINQNVTPHELAGFVQGICKNNPDSARILQISGLQRAIISLGGALPMASGDDIPEEAKAKCMGCRKNPIADGHLLCEECLEKQKEGK